MGSNSVVDCVGSAADISVWELGRLDSATYMRIGRWKGSLLGNDAVIVARELLSHSISARCVLLDPTASDVKAVSRLLGEGAVRGVGGREGQQTRSLGIEMADGRRRWFVSRIPEPVEALGEGSADGLYVDCYREFRSYLREELPKACAGKALTFFNLSEIGDLSDLEQLPVEPDVVQASLTQKRSVEEGEEVASGLLGLLSAKMAVVTLGRRGAVLAKADGVWHMTGARIETGVTLGAGAVLSAQLIKGLLEGEDGEALLRRAVATTAARLGAEELL